MKSLYDGLPAHDGAVDHNALDSSNYERIVDLQIGLGRTGAVCDLNNPVAVVDIGGDNSGPGEMSCLF